jgi:hypothetical protein
VLKQFVNNSVTSTGRTSVLSYANDIVGTEFRTVSQYKIKCTLVQALRLCTGRTAHRGSRGIALPFRDHGTRRGEGSESRPIRSLLPGENLVLIVQEAGWALGRSGQVRKISPPPGFDPRTVQPVASRYTDYATRPTQY